MAIFFQSLIYGKLCGRVDHINRYFFKLTNLPVYCRCNGLSWIMNHLFDSCAKQWWVSFFKVFNCGRLCRKTAFNFSVVQVSALMGSWKSVAEIFLLQVALGSATLFPHRSRCLRTGNFSPPIKSKNLFFFFSSLPLSNCIPIWSAKYF